MSDTQNVTQTPVLTLSDNAVKKITELMAADPDAQGKQLRIHLSAGGCSGYEYGFGYDVQKPGDHAVTSGNVTILVDEQSAALLQGSIVDYREEFGSEGFAIQNPNVKKSCGCGNSVEI